MGPAWAHAFVVASLLTLVGTPLLRRVALATEFVDHPVASHKSHHTPTPYLGGVGLICAALIGLMFAARLGTDVGVVALGGVLIGCLGLIDDHRSVGALLRFVAETLVAVGVLATGLRIHATDVPAIDGVITILWIVGVTNAVNLLDNMDGLAAGVSVAAGSAIFGLAVLGEQRVTATIAAGVVGACIGFLVHNKRPASIFMGDTGSLFLGFVLAVVSIDVSPALRPPTSFAVPLMLLALPVLDTATVSLSRLRRGLSVSQGGRDHLSHRLVAGGLPPAWAVRVLVMVEACVGVLAVLVGREVLPLWFAALLAAAVLSALSLFSLRAVVYVEPVVGLPRRLRLLAVAAVAGIFVLAAPAATSLARAWAPGGKGADAARRGLDALQAGDGAGAEALFQQAAVDLRRADAILGGPMNSMGLVLPGLRANVASARALVEAGLNVTDAAANLSAVVRASELPLDPATNPAQGMTALAPALTDSAAVLSRSAALLAGYDRPYLWPALGGKVRSLRLRLAEASEEASTEARAAGLVPALMGTNETRHYFLAVMDNTELRGSGGVPHIWGEIVAENGRLRLTHLGPIEELNTGASTAAASLPPDFAGRYEAFGVLDTWQNVSVSPDFAVTGQIISSLYASSGGHPVDGVIGVDLPGLARLVELTGPVRVEGWPEPIDGDDFTDTVVLRALVQLPDEQDRAAFVQRLVGQVLTSFLSSDLGTPDRLVGTLAGIVHEGHLALYAERPAEQALFEEIGGAGRPVVGSGDSVFVVNENLTATGIDAYLRRSIRYDVHLDPGRVPAAVSSQLTVTLENSAPTSGLPRQAIGPYDNRFIPGENRTFLSLYSPLPLASPRADLNSEPELGMSASSAILTIPSKESRTATLDLAGRVSLAAGGWYRLNLPHQPTLSPDDIEVLVSLPAGWEVSEVQGMRKIGSRRAVASLSPSGPAQVAVRVQRTPWSRLWSSERG